MEGWETEENRKERPQTQLGQCKGISATANEGSRQHAANGTINSSFGTSAP